MEFLSLWGQNQLPSFYLESYQQTKKDILSREKTVLQIFREFLLQGMEEAKVMEVIAEIQ